LLSFAVWHLFSELLSSHWEHWEQGSWEIFHERLAAGWKIYPENDENVIFFIKFLPTKLDDVGEKMLLRFIISFIGLAACSQEQAERDELGRIAQGSCKYTLMSYKVNELSSNQREYCRMQEENFEMFFLLHARKVSQA